MKKTIFLLTTSFILASCSHHQIKKFNPVTACTGNPNNSPSTTIKYNYGKDGEIDIKVKLKSNGNSGEFFRIILKPTGGLSNDVTIETEGVSVASSDETIQDPSWLDATGSYNSTASTNNAFVLCVPDVPSGTSYKFNIYVKDKDDPTKNIITIDPRFDVN